jgi:hypothetical protein
MSINRWDKRRDETEKPLIKDLKKCGFQVRQQDFPDLIVRRPAWPSGMVQLLEVDGITKNRKRSDKQLGFIREWQIPIVKTTEDALKVLDAFIRKPPTFATCTSKLSSASTVSVGARGGYDY